MYHYNKTHIPLCILAFGVLSLGLFPAIQGQTEASALAQETHLMNLVDQGDVEQFKQEISRVARANPTKHTNITTHVSDYIRSVRNQKAIQLAQNNGRSQKIACTKAAFCSLLFCSATVAQLACIKTWVGDVYNVSKGEASENITAKETKFRAIAYFHYLFMPALMYSSFSWTHENAQFALHGNNILIADIQKLDQMLASVDELDIAV